MRVVAILCYLVHLVFLELAEAQGQTVEVAPYTVIKDGQGYEERAYPVSFWVCHRDTLRDPTTSVNSFWPLYGYISGANKEEKTIPMTAPVTVKLKQKNDTVDGTWDAQMCFYLPEAQQKNPPDPLNEALQVLVRPAMHVFARRIGGNLTSEEWVKLANELKTTLKSAEPTADLSTYYIAGYDSPSKTTNRRNEAWFRKT